MNAPARPLDIMPKAVPMTAAAFDALVQQGHFEADPNVYELIDGAMVMVPPPGSDHEFVTGRVLDAVADGLRAAGLRAGAELIPNGALEIDGANLVSPDFMLGPRRTSPRRWTADELYLVIEIAWSSRTFDTQDKARLYASAGVADYWVLDIPARTVLIHRAPVEGAYTSVQALEAPAFVSPLQMPGLSVAVADLF